MNEHFISINKSHLQVYKVCMSLALNISSVFECSNAIKTFDRINFHVICIIVNIQCDVCIKHNCRKQIYYDCVIAYTCSRDSMWGMSSRIIWKEVTESEELTMFLDTVSNSWHTQSVMWVMSISCLESEKKVEGWESKTSVIIVLLKNNILTINLHVYMVLH